MLYLIFDYGRSFPVSIFVVRYGLSGYALTSPSLVFYGIDQCFFEESINQRLLIGKTGNKQQVSNQQSVRSQYLQKMMDNKVKGSRRGLVRAATRVLRVEVME